MTSQRIFHPFLTVWLPAAVLVLAHGVARADGPPLILSTQTGINDGQTGIVLQNAPLEHRPMVAAQKPAAPAELAPDSSQPYVIVEPRIKVPGGTTQSGSTRPSKSASLTRPSLRSQTSPTQ